MATITTTATEDSISYTVSGIDKQYCASAEVLLYDMNGLGVTSHIYSQFRIGAWLSTDSSGDGYITGTFTGPGIYAGTTYTVHSYVYDASGNVTSNLVQTVTTDAQVVSVPKPNPFYWYTGWKQRGRTFDIKAFEWNEFTECINLLRDYAFFSPYPFTYVYPGDTFAADIFNEAVDALQHPSFGPEYSLVGTRRRVTSHVTRRDEVTALLMNDIVRDYNSAVSVL